MMNVVDEKEHKRAEKTFPNGTMSTENISKWHSLALKLTALDLVKFSVFTSHMMKTKNRNHSINKVKNLRYDR